MTYELEFLRDSWKEWENLDSTLKARFKKKLAERLENPRVESSRLHGLPDCYKIKLRRSGYRLVYQVEDQRLVVLVVAVGKRERNLVYETASKRLT
jgi:mRNA interferase RelE/StbE